MTQEEIIHKIEGLRQIKPSKEWVFLTKNSIIGNEGKTTFSPEKSRSFFNGLVNLLMGLKGYRVAYALAALLFALAGAGGLVNLYSMTNNEGIVGLSAVQEAARNDIELLKAKSQNLTEIAKDSQNKEDVDLAVKEVEEITKGLIAKLKKEPNLAREVAQGIVEDADKGRTYLEISGSEELKEISDVLYKTIVEQMIKDMEGAVLTESQQESLSAAKEMYNNGNYAKAMESILLIGGSAENDGESGSEEGGGNDNIDNNKEEEINEKN